LSLLCATANAGLEACSTGGLCYPLPGTPFRGTVCVSAPGNVDCPPGYGAKFSFDQSLVDNRTCSPCACGPTAGACFTQSTVFAGANCTSTGFVFQDDDACRGLSAGMTVPSISLAVQSPCAASGGAPTGLVKGSKPVTVCCQ